mmetsp:Transcript_21431/g.64076  ORF Transcript_21431/g.64076 Transcript_21431/m.64076 type:complete len:437 (-) Transcript_21431:63-1373(-)
MDRKTPRRTVVTSRTETITFLALLVCTVSTAVWAQTSTGTWVRLTIKIGRDQLLRANVYILTTFSAINEFWASGAKPVAIITGAGTGALPYAQLLAYAGAWLLPLGPSLRAWLCAGFVQLVRVQHMLTMAAMLLVVALKVDAPLPDLDAAARVRVVMGWGCFGFELANFTAYGLALWLAAAHARSGPRILALGGAPESLTYEGRAPLFRRVGARLGSALVLVPLLVIGPALFAPVVRFSMHELGRQFVAKKERDFSVYRLAAAFSGSTRRAASRVIWTAWMALFLMIFDLLAALSLAALWFCPLGPRGRRRAAVAACHFHALAAADVLAVVVGQIAAYIPYISSWIIDAMVPDGLCDTVEQKTRFGGCAVVEGRYLWGVGFLGAYAAAKNLAFFYVFAILYREALPRRMRACVPELPAAPAERRDPLLLPEGGDLT